ncbi:hypothetical protein CHCC20440_4177 [Bacillus licheniformis]|nr:hypothetical protein CHCC20440_4177 [Bacillus licheniformis]
MPDRLLRTTAERPHKKTALTLVKAVRRFFVFYSPVFSFP